MPQEIDAAKITAVTLEGACPDCFGQEQVWVKAERHQSGNTYLYHNRCGWCTVLEDKWEDYVAARIAEGYITILKVVYGNAAAPEVTRFRLIRDNILSRSVLGRIFIKGLLHILPTARPNCFSPFCS